MKQKPLTFQSLEEFAKPVGIKPCESHGLKTVRNRLRQIREQLPEEPQTMADPLNEKPTLQSILADCAYRALDALPGPNLIESVVIVRTTDISNIYEYSVQAKLRGFSLDDDVAKKRLVDALVEFRNALEVAIQKAKA